MSQLFPLLIDWEVWAECPDCGKVICHKVTECGVGRALEAVSEKLTRHAFDFDCKLTAGVIRFRAQAGPSGSLSTAVARASGRSRHNPASRQ